MCCHIRSRHFYIFISGNIHTCGIIGFVIFSGCDREGGYGAFAMIHNRIDIRRKYGVCIVVDRYCRVCPPQEGLWKVGRIIQLTFDLNVCFFRIKCDGCHPLGTIHFVGLSYIDRAGTVGIFRKTVIYR